MVLSCLIAVSVASVQSPLADPALQAKVSFECAAAPATSVVRALAEETKLKLSASTAHAVDVVFVHSSDVAIAELMKRIADVTSSEWRKGGDTYRLVRSAASEKREVDAEYQRRLVGLTKSYEILAKRAAPTPPIPLAQTFVDSAFNRTLPKLIANIGLKHLASIEMDDRIVFSTSPNRMQRPLGFSHDQLMALIADNFNAYRAGRQRAQTPASIAAILDRLVPSEDGSSQAKREPKGLLTVTRTGSTLRINGIIYNAEGKVALSTSLDLHEDPLLYNPELRPKPPKQEGANAAIQLSDANLEISSWFAKNGALPISTTLQRFARPDLHEPYSFGVSDCLAQVAKCKKLNIVANLPDTLSPVHGVWAAQLPKTVNDYLAGLKADKFLNIADAGGWLTITSSAPAATRRNRVDRTALARLIQSCRGTGNARLADLAEFAATDSTSASESVESPFYLMFCPNAMSMGENLNDREMLRFYASLNVDQRRAFHEGATLPLDELSARQRALLSELLYNGNASLALTMTPPGVADSSNVSMNGPTWMSEPTELMPNGPPRDLVLHVAVSKSFAAMHEPGTNAFGGGSKSSVAIGTGIAAEEEFEGKAFDNTLKLAIGARELYQCSFPVAAGVTLRKSLGDDFYEPGATYRPWDQLPEEFRRAVDQAVALERERRAAQRSRPKPPPQ